MKFIVVQIGARRGYAVPTILENAGMLERLYTDLCGNVGLGKALAGGKRLPLIGAILARLGARQVPNEIIAKTRTFESAAVRARLLDILGGRDPERKFRRRVEMSQIRARAMIRKGLGNATHVYSMFREGGEFLEEAYRRGLTIVSEIYIPLSIERLMLSERHSFPNWEPEVPDYAALRRRLIKEDLLLTRTHFYVCPSDFVRDDLVKHWAVPAERTLTVPYGMNPQWLVLEPCPVPRRVLFVGTAGLRKGIHYLALAAEKLRRKGRTYDFRVAGDATKHVRQQAVCRHLHFLNRIPRTRIREEFQAADVFVLPSLAEGSAEVTYEALAAGVPLVTTQAAGSVARNGIEGYIVPERDPDALADALENIVEHRALRHQMSCAARERANDYTWKRYGERLVAALHALPHRLASRSCLG